MATPVKIAPVVPVSTEFIGPPQQLQTGISTSDHQANLKAFLNPGMPERIVALRTCQHCGHMADPTVCCKVCGMR